MSMTKLNQNTTDLQALAASTGYQEVLDMVNALPDGGSGAAVETCTVTVTANKLAGHTYTAFIDGAMTPMAAFGDVYGAQSNTTVTLNNVVCGSAIFISSNGSYADAYTTITVTGGAELVHKYYVGMSIIAGICIKAPTVGGSTGTVNVYYES